MQGGNRVENRVLKIRKGTASGCKRAVGRSGKAPAGQPAPRLKSGKANERELRPSPLNLTQVNVEQETETALGSGFISGLEVHQGVN